MYDNHMMHESIRSHCMAHVSMEWFNAAIAYAKKTGNLHDFMAYLCGC